MKNSKLTKLITAIIETILAIPVLGGLIVIGSGWSILGIMLILHIVAIIFNLRPKRKFIIGNTIGVIGSLVGWIPFLGLGFHMVTAIILWIELLVMK